MTSILLVLAGLAHAQPRRAPLQRSFDLEPGWGRSPDVLIVKLAEGQDLRFEAGQLAGPGDLSGLRPLLAGAQPLFPREPGALRADRRTFDPEGRLADLSLYLRIVAPDAAALGARLRADPRVETAYLAFRPAPPPADIPPMTPDFTDQQGYAGPAPGGLGFDEAPSWPGGGGANVSIADIEYGWHPSHEDLGSVSPAVAWGWDSGAYAYHGTAVLGVLAAEDNGYGVTGLAPDADVFVVSPYADPHTYSVAAAIDGAAALMDAGDVILIEQQGVALYGFAPVEVDPAVFDAIALAVAKGIVVVEPAGNGGQDLDDPAWDGWFDRDVRDSGAIVVGGGASPLSGYPARSWYPAGSCYGSRVDLQGWYDGIVTTADAVLGDLFLPDNDDDQGYTSQFGGTSGASPMIAAAAAVANSVAWELWGQPWDPLDLRQALVSTGIPQPASDDERVGPQPDVRRLLWAWGVR